MNDRLIPDGGVADLHQGRRTSTMYYWVNPDTGGALEHVGVNDE